MGFETEGPGAAIGECVGVGLRVSRKRDVERFDEVESRATVLDGLAGPKCFWIAA